MERWAKMSEWNDSHVPSPAALKTKLKYLIKVMQQPKLISKHLSKKLLSSSAFILATF